MSSPTTGGRLSTRVLVLGILVVSLLLAGVASYYASTSPDGLQRVASDTGVSSAEASHAAEDSPLAGYATEGVEQDRLSGGVAGVLGVGAVAVVMGGLVLLVRRRTPDRED